MADLSDNGMQRVSVDPIIITDSSGTTTYVGVSSSFSNENASVWKIKKFWQVGSVTCMGFPGGSQCFSFVWSCRCGYSYHL